MWMLSGEIYGIMSAFQAKNKFTQPKNAMTFFLNEKRAQYAAKYPDMSDQELTRHMVQAYTKLNHEKKVQQWLKCSRF